MPPSSLDRHVSFASPPVDVTIPAASYPSSPESTRSPPFQHGQTVAPFTPDYRTALRSDPFEDLRQHTSDDHTIRQALPNTPSNTAVEQNGNSIAQHDAVRSTLDRFAAAPRHSHPSAPPVTAHQPSVRQSIDVDAFARLLLTGDHSQNTSAVAAPSTSRSGARVLSDTSSSTDTASLSQNSLFDSTPPNTDETPRSSHDQERDAAIKHVPPPAPAPRRGKSVKAKHGPPLRSANEEIKPQNAQPADQATATKPALPRKPPTPPLARRHSQRTPSIRGEDTAASPSSTEPASPSPSETPRPATRPPPPPPTTRRQASDTGRRPSFDLAPTIEEPADAGDHPSISSRKSSDGRPPPIPSRNSSVSVKRASLGLMNPPPLPPPRRGRGSSRSSIDSFRPSLATLVGDENSTQQGQVRGSGDFQESGSGNKDAATLNSLSATNILAELANLQREVDAARRGA